MNNRRYYHKIFTTSRKFYHEIFILEQNSRNHKSFLPRKFGAIRHRQFEKYNRPRPNISSPVPGGVECYRYN